MEQKRLTQGTPAVFLACGLGLLLARGASLVVVVLILLFGMRTLDFVLIEPVADVHDPDEHLCLLKVLRPDLAQARFASEVPEVENGMLECQVEDWTPTGGKARVSFG